jgi:hypothetical protein
MLIEGEKVLGEPQVEPSSLNTLLSRLASNGAGPALIEALGKGRIDASLVKKALGPKLAPEHHALVDALFAGLQTDRPADEEPTDRQGTEHKQELSDLRQVNDTLASALGACPVCWGGDPRCAECGGHGASGSAAPDPKLFEQLVVPAVRRMAAQRRTARSGPSRYRG